MSIPTVSYNQNGITVTQQHVDSATTACPNGTKSITATNIVTGDYAVAIDDPGTTVITATTGSSPTPIRKVKYSIQTVKDMSRSFPMSYIKGKTKDGSSILVEISTLYRATVTSSPSDTYEVPCRAWVVLQNANDVAWSNDILDAQIRDVVGALFAEDETGDGLLKKCMRGSLNPLN